MVKARELNRQLGCRNELLGELEAAQDVARHEVERQGDLVTTLRQHVAEYESRCSRLETAANSASQQLNTLQHEHTDARRHILWLEAQIRLQHTHTHPFNGPFSRTTRVGQYQKGKTNLDFTEARESGWQWHQLGRMQVCTSLQTDNHASTPPLSFFTGRMPFLPPNQQRQSTEGNKISCSN